MLCGRQVHLKQGKVEKYVPCGQCMNCRINRKRLWTGRILLENRYQKRQSSFVTLTYNEDNLPNRGSLQPRDLQQFLNRLRNRKSIAALGSTRYFAVGEYGDESWRPHYHLALFGVQPEYEQEIIDCWKSEQGTPMGFVQVGEITRASAHYIAGYTTKKMTSRDDPRIDEQYIEPEFARMSKFPPLGAVGIKQILDHHLHTREGAIALAERGDVPTAFRLEGKEYPIGRYWRHKLREELGITEYTLHEPWVIDPEKFHVDSVNASKKCDRLWEKNRTRRNTPSTI